jgi:hypothetical protein
MHAREAKGAESDLKEKNRRCDWKLRYSNFNFPASSSKQSNGHRFVQVFARDLINRNSIVHSLALFLSQSAQQLDNINSVKRDFMQFLDGDVSTSNTNQQQSYLSRSLSLSLCVCALYIFNLCGSIESEEMFGIHDNF